MKKIIVAVWNVNKMVESLSSMGQKLTVEFKSDGSMESEAFGNGTWELTSANEGTIKQSDGNLKLSMKDGKLVITGSDGNMTFTKAQ